MKTLFSWIQQYSDVRPSRAETRAPKKFWRIDIECPDFIWRGYCTERPCFKNLFEVWAYELGEATRMLNDKTLEKFDRDVWQRRLDVASDLMYHLEPLKNKRTVVGETVNEFDIEVQEDVLF